MTDGNKKLKSIKKGTAVVGFRLQRLGFKGYGHIFVKLCFLYNYDTCYAKFFPGSLDL